MFGSLFTGVVLLLLVAAGFGYVYLQPTKVGLSYVSGDNPKENSLCSAGGDKAPVVVCRLSFEWDFDNQRRSVGTHLRLEGFPFSWMLRFGDAKGDLAYNAQCLEAEMSWMVRANGTVVSHGAFTGDQPKSVNLGLLKHLKTFEVVAQRVDGASCRSSLTLYQS
jgi:hypothetical protein